MASLRTAKKNKFVKMARLVKQCLVRASVPQGSVLSSLQFVFLQNSITEKLDIGTRVLVDDCVVTNKVKTVGNEVIVIDIRCRKWRTQENAEKPVRTISDWLQNTNFEVQISRHDFQRGINLG